MVPGGGFRSGHGCPRPAPPPARPATNPPFGPGASPRSRHGAHPHLTKESAITGAEVPKDEQQQAIRGGVAGEAFDQCYHQACDDLDNVNLEALDVNLDAIALAVSAYSYSRHPVNGVTGVPVPGGFERPAPAGPEGAAVSP